MAQRDVEVLKFGYESSLLAAWAIQQYLVSRGRVEQIHQIEFSILERFSLCVPVLEGVSGALTGTSCCEIHVQG